MTRALAIALSLFAASAGAWESVCNQYADPTAEVLQLGTPAPCSPSAGPNTARQRWVGNLDEHRLLLLQAASTAAIPAAALATQRHRIYTLANGVAVGSSTQPTMMPAFPEVAERVQVRAFTVAELAQLPDYSYGLWDWAQGHESCPPGLGTTDPAFCHDFASHMGAVNSNHFGPLAQRFYIDSHKLAKDKARDCNLLTSTLGVDAPRFTALLQACAVEALALEAIAQHYLQDAWSTGHMWQRWGSPNLSDFPGNDDAAKRETAVLVALSAGLIHGSRGVLQKLPDWTSFDVNDALCAPHASVRYSRSGVLSHGVGDDYLWALPPFGGGDTYQAQWSQLLACSASGLLQVYKMTLEPFGPATPSGFTPLSETDFTGEACFGQKATNEALLQGMSLDFKLVGQQVNLVLDSRLVGELVPVVATESGEAPVSAITHARFRVDLQRQVSLARLWAKKDPTGTQIAEGRLGEFLAVQPNAIYALDFGTGARPAQYFDPPLPWPGSNTGVDAARARSSALFFKDAHAWDFCSREDSGLLSGLVARAQNPALDAPTKAAACEACTDVIQKHLRVGTAASFETAREPFCRILSSTAAVVYQPGAPTDSIESLARAHCGC